MVNASMMCHTQARLAHAVFTEVTRKHHQLLYIGVVPKQRLNWPATSSLSKNTQKIHLLARRALRTKTWMWSPSLSLLEALPNTGHWQVSFHPFPPQPGGKPQDFDVRDPKYPVAFGRTNSLPRNFAFTYGTSLSATP